MQQTSTTSSASSSPGPLRRNQACHQCRARKLVSIPCSTCKRSHAKAVASLTSSGQAVLADPCCTYDYAPGEDPWTATVRNGLGLSPPISRSKSGSTSPAGSSGDVSMTQATRHTSTSRKRSPRYDSAYVGSPASLGHLSSTGAQDAFLSPLPPQVNIRGLPALPHASELHTAPPYISSHTLDAVSQDIEYEEMAQMLYNPMSPFFDLTMQLSPLPSYVDQLPVGGYSGNEMPIYAHDGDGLASSESGPSSYSTNLSLTPASGHNVLMQDPQDADPIPHTSDVFIHMRNPTP
ncbi:hypothetical protein B0J17DRAFT_666060 [Rhizoctonia solani]|nr:hypothetical protein B0J17DRAFT_666060 [Rhizoctonia solani]